jgi:FtsH-binding integral membrane protein
MQLFRLHFNNKIRNLFHSDFWIYERSVWLHMLAQSVVSIFVAILLLQSGYTLNQVIFYYFLFYLFDVPMNYAAFYSVKFLGARWTVVIGVLAKIAFFVGLSLINGGSMWALVLLALFDALYDTFYYVSHFFIFMSLDTPSKSREHTGVLTAVQKLAGLLGPVVGAGLLLFVSENALIYAVIALLALSLVPLFQLHHLDNKPKVGKPRFSDLGIKARRTFGSLMLWGIHTKVEITLIPLFIFSVVGTIESVAIIPVLISAAAIFLSYFVGRDHKHSMVEMIIKMGPILLVIWILRLIVISNIFFYISIVIVSLMSLLISIPMDANIFKLGEVKREHALSVSLYRNMINMVGGLIIFTILTAWVSVFHGSFIMAAIAICILVIFNILWVMKRSKA